MDRLAESEPRFRQLQSRAAVFRRRGTELLQKAKPIFKTRKFAVCCYLFAAFLLVAAAAANVRLVRVQDGSKAPAYILTMRRDAGAILQQCGVTVSGDDAVKFSGFKSRQATIRVLRAYPVSLAVDNQVRSVHIAKGTVADVLRKSGVTLGTDDIVTPSLGTSVAKGMAVVVQRVQYQTVVLSRDISCKLDRQQTPLLKRGDTQVIDAGKSGQKAITTLMRFVNGALAEQTVIAETVVKNPVDGMMLVGTAKNTPVSRMEPGGMILDSRGDPTRYSKCLVGNATAYTAHTNAGTASGRRAGVGVVAVDPNLIPYGSRLYIVSSDGSFVYGNAVAGDTGTFTSNGSDVLVDLYFSTMKECCVFGEHKVKVYVLE